VRRSACCTALLVLLVVAGCSDDHAPTTAVGTPTPGPSTAAPSTPAATAPVATPGPVDPLSPAPPLETAPPVAGPVCRVGDLTVVDADSVSDGGYSRELFVIRTTGPDCRLQGYPQVWFLRADGKALPLTTSHGGYGLPPSAPTSHTLSRGTSLSFAVASSEAGSCVQVARLEVRLPQTSGPLSAGTSMSVCGGRTGLSPVGRLADID
jgi:hypothetical protein